MTDLFSLLLLLLQTKASAHKQDHVKDDKKHKVSARNTKRALTPSSSGSGSGNAPPPPPLPSAPTGSLLAPPTSTSSPFNGAAAALGGEGEEGSMRDDDDETVDGSEAEIEVNLCASLFDSHEVMNGHRRRRHRRQ